MKRLSSRGFGRGRRVWPFFTVVPLAVATALAGGSDGRADPNSPRTATVPIPGNMVTIPGGTFEMGADNGLSYDQRPAHTVSVATFQLDVTEVTVGAYRACLAAGSCKWPNYIGCPKVDQVIADSYAMWCLGPDDAEKFCKWAGKRLPTEEEWEYAARGGSEGRTYPWGELPVPTVEPGPWKEADFICWNRGAADNPGPCKVGTHPKTNGKWGLMDMAGNVMEWTSSVYSTDYNSPRNQSVNGVPTKVLRGGGWAASDFTAIQTVRRHQGIASWAEWGARCAK